MKCYRHCDDIKALFRCLHSMIDEAERLFDEQNVLNSREKLWICKWVTAELTKEINYIKLGSADQRYITEATSKEVEQLLQLNNQLARVEKEIRVECRRIKSELYKRLIFESEQFLDDFEVDVEVQYYFSEDDSACSEDDYCCMAIDTIFTIPEEDDEKINWNDLGKGTSVGEQRHCYLFHSLCNHVRPRLSLGDILRIETVWVDIKILHQKEIVLDKSNESIQKK